MNTESIKKEIEKLESEIREENRLQGKACEYKRFGVAQEHEENIWELESKVRELGRKIGILSFDMGLEFEHTDTQNITRTWKVSSMDESGLWCRAKIVDDSSGSWESGFRIEDNKIVE